MIKEGLYRTGLVFSHLTVKTAAAFLERLIDKKLV